MEKINYETFRDNTDIPYFREVEYNECWLHFHRNMELLYIIEGSVSGTIDHCPYTFVKDEIVAIPHYFPHNFFTPDYSKVIILVIPYNLSNDFLMTFKKKRFDFRLQDKEFNLNILEVLKILQKHYSLNSALLMKGLINSVLGLLLHHYSLKDIKPNHNLNFVINVLEYIEKFYDQEITLERMASTFGYNKDYFSKLFNQSVGCSLTSYVNRIRVDNALNQLKSSYDRNIQEIILNNGFDSPATFYRVFKNIYHTSPLEFIKSN